MPLTTKEMIQAIRYGRVWFIALAMYGAMVATTRLTIIRYLQPDAEDGREELERYRNCGLLMVMLAFAVTFPEMVFYFFGLVPIKAKWFGAIIGVQFAVDFFRGGMPTKIGILVSLLNFIVFFLMTRDMKRLSPQEIIRKEKFRRESSPAAVQKMRPSGTIHRCAVCGKTEKDDPSLEFRYCSKCAGNMEYCMEHLYTHVHVTDGTGEENG